MARNIMHFTTDDVETLIGREPSEEEYQNIVSSLANNPELTVLFADTVYTFTTDKENTD